jgi:hypothetical protein
MRRQSDQYGYKGKAVLPDDQQGSSTTSTNLFWITESLSQVVARDEWIIKRLTFWLRKGTGPRRRRYKPERI